MWFYIIYMVDDHAFLSLLQSYVSMQLGGIDYTGGKLLQKIPAFFSQVKKQSNLSNNIKVERRTWHEQQQHLIDTKLNVSVWRQEIACVCGGKVARRLVFCFFIPIWSHWRIQQALSYKIASCQEITWDREVEREGKCSRDSDKATGLIISPSLTIHVLVHTKTSNK